MKDDENFVGFNNLMEHLKVEYTSLERLFMQTLERIHREFWQSA